MAIEIKIKNIDKIRYAFSKAPRILEKNMRIAMGKSVTKIRSTSSSNSPVDTGYLRSSHYTNFQAFRGEVGARANYAPYVHWGTRYQRSQPFLQRAVDKEKDFVNTEFTVAANNTLYEIARKSK